MAILVKVKGFSIIHCVTKAKQTVGYFGTRSVKLLSDYRAFCLPRLATSNTVYLEGLVEDLRAKLGQMEELERECVSLRVELGLAQGRLSEWTRLAHAVLGVLSVSGPAALRRCIESLQQRELSLTQDKATVESALKNLREAHNETLKELQEANAQLANAKRSLELQATKVRRLRKQITLITWVSISSLNLKRAA